MKRISLNGLTEEYLYITATGPTDPTAKTVQFGFSVPNSPPTVIGGGVWDGPATIDSHGRYHATAKYLLIPNTLADGNWWVWVELAGSPESPVRPVGVLQLGD